MLFRSLTADRDLARYFEQAIGKVDGAVPPKTVANWITGDFLRHVNENEWSLIQPPISSDMLGELLVLLGRQVISGKIAKTVFEEMTKGLGLSPKDIIQSKGLVQISNLEVIGSVVDQVLARSQNQVADYRSGKTKVFSYFVGEVMKASKGQMNPGLVNEIIRKKLEQQS